MVRARSRFEAPRARSERIRRSMETEGSPPSIFATRDWLERRSFPRSLWLRFRFCPRRLRLSPSRSLSSTYAVSSSDRPSNSCAVPNFQPLASSPSCLVLRIIVFLQSPPTSVQDRGRGLGGFLGEYLRNHDCIRVNTIHDAPSGFCVYHPKLVTSRTNG